jgi:hypothetical protein
MDVQKKETTNRAVWKSNGYIIYNGRVSVPKKYFERVFLCLS